MSAVVETVCLIDRSSSKCSACGRGASPDEPYHWTIVEYGPDTGKPGCGAEFVRCVYVFADNRRATT